MSYQKHNFAPGKTIYSSPFNVMEDQIAKNEAAIAGKLNKPSGNGTFGQILQTNGDGSVVWVDAPSGTGGGGGGLTSQTKAALLAIAQKVAYIDANGQSYYQALYNAFNSGVDISSISATFNAGNNTIYENATLDSLKQYLTVTATYTNNTTSTVNANECILSGTLTAGTSTITVSYSGKTATFNVTVTAVAVSSISAVYNGSSHTVYTTDTLDSLKTYLTVTASYNNGTTSTVGASSYTLSGTLTAGTSTITVSYSGKTTTFTVTVTGRTVSSISASFSPGGNTIFDTTPLNDLKQYLTVTATYNDSTTASVNASSYTLSGTLAVGTSTVTVTYGEKTATFSVTVAASLSSISAVLDLNGNTITTSNTLNDLKQYLTVTATYSDSTTSTVSASDYTLSGSLASGTNTITVSYGGKTTTFTVSVSVSLPSGYTRLAYVEANGVQYVDTGVIENQTNKAECEVAITDAPSNKGGHIFSSTNFYLPYFKGKAVSNGNLTGTGVIGIKFKGNETLDTGSVSYDWSLNTRYQIEAYPSIMINGVEVGSMSAGASNSSTNHLYLFTYGGTPSATQYRFYGKLYSMKVYNTSNELLRNFIPAKNSSDVPGLYDTVTETFYTSSSGTELIAGEVA